jgi:hypothetical protein
MVIRMDSPVDSDEDLEQLGQMYAERREQWEQANKDLPNDDTMFVVLAERLDIALPPPIIHNDGMGLLWCDVCAVSVVKAEHHRDWHRRVMAATKVSMWQANLAVLASEFAGRCLRSALIAVREEWIPSGHGWIYPQGDPPGSIRARCGGPAMCAKCRADEQHSLAAEDGAAMAYYVARSIERGEIEER